MSTVQISDEFEFVRPLSRWWILDALGVERSSSESSDYKELTETLLHDCGVADEDALRRIATDLVAKRLQKLR